MIDTNLTSNLYAIACAKLKKGGHIVNFASSAFYRGRKNYALYSGTKAAIVNFTQGLALDSSPLILLGAIPTALLALTVDLLFAQTEMQSLIYLMSCRRT